MPVLQGISPAPHSFPHHRPSNPHPLRSVITPGHHGPAGLTECCRQLGGRIADSPQPSNTLPIGSDTAFRRSRHPSREILRLVPPFRIPTAAQQCPWISRPRALFGSMQTAHGRALSSSKAGTPKIMPTVANQCCGTVPFYLGSGSQFFFFTVPAPAPVPTLKF